MTSSYVVAYPFSEKQSLSMPNNVLGAPVSQVRAVRSVCKLCFRALLQPSLGSGPASVLVNAKLGDVALTGLELTPYPGEGRRAASAVAALLDQFLKFRTVCLGLGC